MSEEQQNNRQKFPISRILRYTGFGILALMLALSLIYQIQNPPETDEEVIEATVQAGVNLGLTQVAEQTGTPDPTAIQSTVEARIDATLTASAPPPPDLTSDIDPDDPMSGLLNTLSAIFAPIIGVLQGMWNFAGIGGIVVQVLCCIIPPILIVVGIAND